MVIGVDGGGFVHEEEEGDRPARYLPIGHVYSASAPALSPLPPLPKMPHVDGGGKPRVEDLLHLPATAPPAVLHYSSSRASRGGRGRTLSVEEQITCFLAPGQ